jgi:hypothetical protein
MRDQDDLTAAIRSQQIADDELVRYQRLLRQAADADGFDSNAEELNIAPLIWWEVKKHIDGSSNPLQHYSVLGYESTKSEVPRAPVLLNTKSPWSAFLCGSQGSGKSYTMSCMLENCLLDEPGVGKNPNPLAGLVLHYDGSRSTGVCEAAYLCSKVKKVTVLVSASNYGNLKKQYKEMAQMCGGEIEVHKLLIAPSHLDTERVKTLMAVTKDGDAPLYIQVSPSGISATHANHAV